MGGRVEVGRKCPYCGAMVSYDEYFCRACHKKFTDVAALDAPTDYKPEEFIVSFPKIWVTAILSVIGVGLGQFYNGDLVKGILFFLGFLAVSFGYLVTPYHNLLYTGIWAAATIEALWSTRRIARCERSYAGISYPLYVLLALLGLVAGLHALTGEPDLAYMAKLFPAVGLWMM
jgi:TM2 domain-containing membrane protein YozV